MPYAIDDADWPWVKRIIQDYKAGRLTRRPKGEKRTGRGGGRGLKLGRTTEAIERGTLGKIKRLAGEQGEESPVGPEFDAFSRFGDLAVDQVVLYARVGRGWEVVQSIGCDVPIPADWYPPETETES